MEIKLYQATETPCSYLLGKQSTSVIVDPDLPITQELTSWMSELGFRRSGEMLYRPNCENCNACQSSRIIIDEFKPSKSQKRILNKAANLSFSVRACSFDETDYRLYENYITKRHKDGDMYPPEMEQYKSFLCKEFGFNYFLEVRTEGKLISLSQFDVLNDGLSAVYTFFDPEYDHLSLGVLSVLQLTTLAKETGFPYVYLGYYVEDCLKMNYKAKYKPLELCIDENWLNFDKRHTNKEPI